MQINIIVAADLDNGIGKDGTLPWVCYDDLKHFKDMTMGHTLLMGRKTFESLPNTLSGRKCIVISKSKESVLHNDVYSDVEDALQKLSRDTNVLWVIGGGTIYNWFLNQEKWKVKHLYLTRILDRFACDVFFPKLDDAWCLKDASDIKTDDKSSIRYQFLRYCKEQKANEQPYLDLLKHVLYDGAVRPDRTGTGTLSLFGKQIRFDMSDVIPVITTKSMAWKTCIKELLWFMRGDTNAKKLQQQGVNIWNGNTTREFLDKRGLEDLPEGDIGAGYGFQWRHFGADYKDCNDDYRGQGVDQLVNVIDMLKHDPYSRRIFMSSWNAGALEKMALPPCHVSVQFYVSDSNDDTKRLSCHMYQRSVDCFLGLPFNIMSYAVLTHILALWCDMKPYELIISTGDTHVYLDHVVQVKEQLARKPFALPKLWINPDVKYKGIDELCIDDFSLIEYNCHPAIKANMSA